MRAGAGEGRGGAPSGLDRGQLNPSGTARKKEKGRRATKYGRRLKPAPSRLAAPSTALALSKRLHRSRYLQRAQKGREALLETGTNGRSNEGPRPTFEPRARGQGLGLLAPAVRCRSAAITRPRWPCAPNTCVCGEVIPAEACVQRVRRGHLKAS